VLDPHAIALLRRLTRWLDQFKDCFGHRAQHVSLRQYVDGLLGDSARKSMSAMLERISEPASYQAFQHFITHAPWEAEVVWRRLRAVIPERTGILILDETSFPKSGPHSVGVARQYCGALGKVANCQVAVTAALWARQRAWPVGALLYLPATWTTDPTRCATVRVPTTVRFQEKWRLALTLVRRARAAGLTLTAVVASACRMPWASRRP
jgi:SRSO17 transposase